MHQQKFFKGPWTILKDSLHIRFIIELEMESVLSGLDDSNSLQIWKKPLLHELEADSS